MEILTPIVMEKKKLTKMDSVIEMETLTEIVTLIYFQILIENSMQN